MTDEQTLALGITAAFVGAILIIALVWYVLQVIAYWKIFKKFGEPGWKAIIPFYNYYIQLKYTWKTTWFWVVLALGIVAGIISAVSGQNADQVSAADYIALAVRFAAAVITVISMYKLSVSFGHGVGYCIGLVLLEPIFILILGFGKSQYIGNVGKCVTEDTGYVYAAEAPSKDDKDEKTDK